jgi:hypothetical protein
MHYIDENEVKIAEAGALELLLTMVVSFKLSLPDGLGWAALPPSRVFSADFPRPTLPDDDS